MRPRRVLAGFLAGALTLQSCSSLREIPRAQLADMPESRDVSVEMRNGLHYEFDSARFGPDSLWGYVRSDSEGTVTELSTTPLALDDVARVSMRRTDWYRTGLLGAAALGAVIAIAVSQHQPKNSSGDGGPVKPPPTLTSGGDR